MAKGNMKSIKRRIKSVGSTLQITKAMEMVASSKLRRAKQRAEALRPYFEALETLISEIAAEKADFATVFTTPRSEIKNRLFIVIAGDRGLAGGFNSNLLKLAYSFEKSGENPPKIITIGKVSADFYKKKNREIIAEYPYFAEDAKPGKCADIANVAADLFRSGEVDEVRVFFTSFISAMQQEATQIQLLPFNAVKEPSPDYKSAGSVNYDPSPEAVFDRIIPKILLSVINSACVESYASEQSARRNAMESASDNAEEMIEKFVLQYNRLRQEKITNEINEIVGGANAIS
ncbi:MAG: ATP synthase F1 subunit gamma [Oscillospiraceae bacterium]|nr:ATP synthase F1 subunit gamma [Oscillospiraceae bacterium]